MKTIREAVIAACGREGVQADCGCNDLQEWANSVLKGTFDETYKLI